MDKKQLVVFTPFNILTNYFIAAYVSVITLEQPQINLSKIGIWGAVFIIVGLILFAFGFPVSLLNEVEDRNIGYFQKENDKYEIQLELSSLQNELYIVAEFDGKTRRDGIESLNILLNSDIGATKEFKLKAKRSSTNEALNSGWYGKKVIIGYLNIDSKSNYHLLIDKIYINGSIDNLVLSLHNNSNRFYEGFVVILSFVLLISGMVLIIIDILKCGYNTYEPISRQ